jgi:hypothetical protein
MDFIDYPWVYPPPGFVRFDRNGTLSVNSGLSNQVAETIQLEMGMDGWLVYAGIELSTYGTVAHPAYFQLKQAGQIIRDYGKVQVPLGAPNTPAFLHVKLFAAQPFTLEITNLTNPALVVAARWRLYGWYYPSKGLS